MSRSVFPPPRFPRNHSKVVRSAVTVRLWVIISFREGTWVQQRELFFTSQFFEIGQTLGLSLSAELTNQRRADHATASLIGQYLLGLPPLFLSCVLDSVCSGSPFFQSTLVKMASKEREKYEAKPTLRKTLQKALFLLYPFLYPIFTF